MAIISPLAYTIANGDPVDATPVQANLSQIVQDVNANAAPIAGSASQQFLVASTTNPAGAVPLAQAQSDFAPISGSTVYAPVSGSSNYASISGSSTQVFNVASASSPTEAVPLQQTLGGGASAYTDQTANRAVGVVYTNNTGRPLNVIVQGAYLSAPAQSFTFVYGWINGANTSTDMIINPTTITKDVYGTTRLIVPPGATYEVTINGVFTLNSWYEY